LHRAIHPSIERDEDVIMTAIAAHTATPTIKIATPSEQAAVTSVVVLAFSTDPMARWSWPSSHPYLVNFPRLVKAFGEKAFAQGSAYYVEDYLGAALWLPPGVGPDEAALTALTRESIARSLQGDMRAIFEQMGRYHPTEPHWFLPLLAVDPAHQRKGYGSALLQPVLERCDREQKLAYLESSNPRNIPLYEQHGFEVLGGVRAGSSPTVVPMLRKPKTRGAPRSA
jgi:GNAT superfamily N-acetyltransferase